MVRRTGSGLSGSGGVVVRGGWRRGRFVDLEGAGAVAERCFGEFGGVEVLALVAWFCSMSVMILDEFLCVLGGRWGRVGQFCAGF